MNSNAFFDDVAASCMTITIVGTLNAAYAT